VDPAGIITTAAGGELGDDTPSRDVALYGPHGVALAPDGTLYIAESGCDRVRRLDRIGVVATLAGNGVRASSGDGGPAADAGLNLPRGVVVGPDGSVYIAESGGHRVRRVDAVGIISTVAGDGEAGYGGDGGPAVEARLNCPRGVAAAADGSIYIADTENHRIRKVGADGIITTVAGNGTPGYSGDTLPGRGGEPMPATMASFNRPHGVAVGPDGSVYIADTGNNRIRRLHPAGFITAVGSDVVDHRFGLRAPDAGLNLPVAVAVSPDGSLYIADTGNHRVRKIDAAGAMITVAGDGIWGYRGDGGPAATAGLWYPRGVAVAADGTLYIGDDCNDRVRRVRWRPCDPEAARTMADAMRIEAGVSVDTWREVAELYLIAKAWDDALAAAQRLLALTPEADQPGRLRAEILAARACAGKGDDDQARRRLIRVLGRTGDPMVLRDAADLLVDIYLRQGRRDQAIATLNDLRFRTHDRQLLDWIDRRLKQIAGDGRWGEREARWPAW
jgi:DNA-binding beta-propeller fold protein YncE